MKSAKAFLQPTVCVIILLFISTIFLSAQEKPNSTSAKALVESQRYIFKAETASPTGGRVRQLTPEYSLTVSEDTVFADLPYFGRAYSAPVGGSGGIKFTSEKFDYTATLDKKNRWQITIKPKDVNDAQDLTLTVFDNRKANLSVRSNSRQPITFYGYITEK